MGFKVEGNWAYIDSYDGKPIEAGDTIRLGWPDGTQTEHVALVSKEQTEVQDMFTKTMVPDHKAYVMVDHAGTAVKIFLRELPEGVEVL